MPPEERASALASVSAPAPEKLDVAVAPKDAELKRAELTNREVVVACVAVSF